MITLDYRLDVLSDFIAQNSTFTIFEASDFINLSRTYTMKLIKIWAVKNNKIIVKTKKEDRIIHFSLLENSNVKKRKIKTIKEKILSINDKNISPTDLNKIFNILERIK